MNPWGDKISQYFCFYGISKFANDQFFSTVFALLRTTTQEVGLTTNSPARPMMWWNVCKTVTLKTIITSTRLYSNISQSTTEKGKFIVKPFENSQMNLFVSPWHREIDKMKKLKVVVRSWIRSKNNAKRILAENNLRHYESCFICTLKP